MKMKVVYEANSLLGDPMTVEVQLNESEHKLEKLRVELKKYQTYLEQANSVQIAQQSPQSNRSLHNGGGGQRMSRFVFFELVLFCEMIYYVSNFIFSQTFQWKW